jgi:hypothetical protein
LQSTDMSKICEYFPALRKSYAEYNSPSTRVGCSDYEWQKEKE